jgi:hypothetical protein
MNVGLFCFSEYTTNAETPGARQDKVSGTNFTHNDARKSFSSPDTFFLRGWSFYVDWLSESLPGIDRGGPLPMLHRTPHNITQVAPALQKTTYKLHPGRV